MSYETTTTRPGASLRTGNPFFDMLFSMQKQALSVYSVPAEQRFAGSAPQQSTSTAEVIALGEEILNVGTRTMQGNTTRLRRVVVETPVEKQVALREEKVIVERRKPTAASKGQDVLTDRAVEMNDTFEVVEAWKSVHLLEEVVLRKEVTEHTETVRDIVRRDEVKVERPSAKEVTERTETMRDAGRRNEGKVEQPTAKALVLHAKA